MGQDKSEIDEMMPAHYKQVSYVIEIVLLTLSTLEFDSMMFWEMSVKRNEDKFTLPSY